MSQKIDKKWTFLTIAKYSSLILLLISVGVLVWATNLTFFGWDFFAASVHTDSKHSEGLLGLILGGLSFVAMIIASLCAVVFTIIFILCSKKLKQHNQKVAIVKDAVIQPSPNRTIDVATVENNETNVKDS